MSLIIIYKKDCLLSYGTNMFFILGIIMCNRLCGGMTWKWPHWYLVQSKKMQVYSENTCT